MNDELLIEECRKVLRRIAWRLQFQAKKISTRELPIIENICGQNQMSSVDSKLHLEEMLNSLPDKARFIIEQVVINGVPEEIVAQSLPRKQLSRRPSQMEGFLKIFEYKFTVHVRARGKHVDNDDSWSYQKQLIACAEDSVKVEENLLDEIYVRRIDPGDPVPEPWYQPGETSEMWARKEDVFRKAAEWYDDNNN